MNEIKVEQVLAKYAEAEKITPAFERVTMFSWNDMLALKNEIETLRAEKERHWLENLS